MFQLCYSLVTLSFRRRSILNENSALLKWKWETFYLENVRLNRLIFFIIKMSKRILLLFCIFPHFFSSKSINLSSETISASDMCTTLLWSPSLDKPHSQLLRPPLAHGGLPTSRHPCTKSHCDSQAWWGKRQREGKQNMAAFELLSPCRAISKRKECKNP